MKKPKVKKRSVTKKLPPQYVRSGNRGYGYHGELWKKHKGHKEQADRSFHEMAYKIMELTGEKSHEKVKHYLDSTHGRMLSGRETQPEYIKFDFSRFSKKYNPQNFYTESVEEKDIEMVSKKLKEDLKLGEIPDGPSNPLRDAAIKAGILPVPSLKDIVTNDRTNPKNKRVEDTQKLKHGELGESVDMTDKLETTANLVDALISKDPSSAISHFDQILKDKLQHKVEEYKAQVANEMFSDDDPEDETESDTDLDDTDLEDFDDDFYDTEDDADELEESHDYEHKPKNTMVPHRRDEKFPHTKSEIKTKQKPNFDNKLHMHSPVKGKKA